jgi:outer membrane murein-binding lipoprotein Lpp
MRNFLLAGVASTLVLAGCSGAEHETAEHVTTVDAAAETMASYDIAEPPPAPAAVVEPERYGESGSMAGAGAIPVGVPQVAYRYAYGFRLPSEAILPLQERHADMCEAKGPDVCRIIAMDQAENEGDYAQGSLTLAVRARDARTFGKELANASGRVDGELVSSSIEGEDLSKNIVDTEARLRARTVLRDRLMEVLRNRKGTVSELVAAERGVAQVNEEIDQATSWLTEMRGRVAYSNMTVSYESGEPATGGFAEPIRSAWNSLGGIFGTMISLLIVLLAVLVPLGLLVWLGAKALRRLGLTTGIGAGWTRPEEAESA